MFQLILIVINIQNHIAIIFYHFQAKAPGRTKLRRLINKMAAEVMDRIIIALVKSRRVSITTDIWSSKLSVNSYIGITCHMVNPSTRKREVYRVCCRVFDVEHTHCSYVLRKIKDNSLVKFLHQQDILLCSSYCQSLEWKVKYVSAALGVSLVTSTVVYSCGLDYCFTM